MEKRVAASHYSRDACKTTIGISANNRPGASVVSGRYDTQMPRFVILRHETPPGYERPTHFDLMLEWGESLRTWALPSFPQVGESIEAEELAPHRREYLDYEGDVSGGRGCVERRAAGEFVLIESQPDSMRVGLHSPELVGVLRVARLVANSTHWTITLCDKSPDK